jgi:flagellar FliJ protein
VALQPKPFSLDIVLSYRKRLEDLAKNRLFEARKVHQIIKEKLESERLILETTIDKTEQLQREGVDITMLILYEERISTLQKNVAAIEKNVHEKAKIVESERQNVHQRSREYQVMERLKTEQNDSWQRYLDKKEAAMLDEVAIMRHGKNPFEAK